VLNDINLTGERIGSAACQVRTAASDGPYRRADRTEVPLMKGTCRGLLGCDGRGAMPLQVSPNH